MELNYPILSDPKKEAAKAFGVLRGPFPKRWTFYVGKDGKIAKVDKNVKPATAGADLVKILKELKW